MISRLALSAALLAAGLGAQVQLARSILLPGVQGRIDHLAFDAATHRVFVAALANGSVEVVDIVKGERATSLPGLREPQGIVLVPATREVVVACAGGDLCVIDADRLVTKRKVPVGEDADNIRLAPDGATLVVGYGSGALAVLDAKSLEKRFEVALPGHPESFQFDAKTGDVWVNVPSASATVARVDLAKRAITKSTRLRAASKNYPMCIDAAQRRVFVGCRAPARLVVLDADTGEEVGSSECVGDADDVFLEPESTLVIVIGGGGSVDELSSRAPFAKAVTQPTAPGARTGLLVAEAARLFVARPAQKDREAALLELQFPSHRNRGTSRPSSR